MVSASGGEILPFEHDEDLIPVMLSPGMVYGLSEEVVERYGPLIADILSTPIPPLFSRP